MGYLTLILLSLAAFFAGFIDSVAGGGGLISLPALLAAGLPAQAALGTNKLQSAIGTFFGLSNFIRRGKVVWKISIIGVPLAFIGSVIGAKLTLFLSQSVLAKVIIILLPPAAILLMLSNTIIKNREETVPSKFNFWFLTPLMCMLIGFYDGFFGPGAGTFLIIVLVIAAHLPFVNATATAKTFNLASNSGALVTFILSGHVYYFYALPMAVTNICGNLVGSHFAMKHGHNFIRKLLIVSLSILFVYLVWRYF